MLVSMPDSYPYPKAMSLHYPIKLTLFCAKIPDPTKSVKIPLHFPMRVFFLLIHQPNDQRRAFQIDSFHSRKRQSVSLHGAAVRVKRLVVQHPQPQRGDIPQPKANDGTAGVSPWVSHTREFEPCRGATIQDLARCRSFRMG